MIHPLEEPAVDLVMRNRHLERRVAELERAASARRETDALHERFLSTLCHELRTPLAALSACREILATRSARLTPERTVRFQDLLCREAGRLGGLLEALLELDRQGSRTPRSGGAQVLVSEVVHEAAALLEPLAANRQVRLKLDTGQADTRIQANRDPLRHLVLHLGSNAIRFTPEGGTVTIRLESDAHGVSLMVEDTGIGIPAESVDRVFERFHRVEGARAHREGGSGIGLALCRSIAESHGGSISVASGTDRGSRFTVTLPRPQEGVNL
jgi:two-component system phosphate regulon sensor histidine kinase PhoR